MKGKKLQVNEGESSRPKFFPAKENANISVLELAIFFLNYSMVSISINIRSYTIY